MTVDQAQSAVTGSAFVVAGVFAYRKLTESSVQSRSTPQVGHFVLGFGVVYIVLSLIAQAAPDLGGIFAVLVATGDLLENGQGLVTDINRALKGTQTATGGKA